ncbi:plasmid replication initiation protein, partial [Enterobacter roggenkampii]
KSVKCFKSHEKKGGTDASAQNAIHDIFRYHPH